MKSRIETHEENIEFLSSQVKELNVSMNSVKEVFSDLPKTKEKMMLLGAQSQHGSSRPGTGEEEYPFAEVLTEDYESRKKPFNVGIESII